MHPGDAGSLTQQCDMWNERLAVEIETGTSNGIPQLSGKRRQFRGHMGGHEVNDPVMPPSCNMVEFKIERGLAHP